MCVQCHLGWIASHFLAYLSTPSQEGVGVGVFISFLSPILFGLKLHRRKAFNVGVTLIWGTLFSLSMIELKNGSQGYRSTGKSVCYNSLAFKQNPESHHCSNPAPWQRTVKLNCMEMQANGLGKPLINLSLAHTIRTLEIKILITLNQCSDYIMCFLC